MKLQTIQRIAALFFVWTSLLLLAPEARALGSGTYSALPGAEQWQPYLDQSPVDPAQLAADPLSVLSQFLPTSLWETLRAALRSSADTFLFLALAALVSFLGKELTDAALLDLVAAGGCGILLWGKLLDLAQQLCTQTENWKNFLLGFLPVYAGVLTMGGETAAGGAASGFFLTALCALAQCLTAFLKPLLQCYLALSMACCISRETGLAAACKGVGILLRRGLGWGGKLLTLLLSVQRIAALQLDRAALHTGKFLTGSIPIVGQSLSDASEAILGGLQLLKSGLGLAALAFLAAEFVPLYLGILAQLLLLYGCSLFCGLTGVSRCQALLDCFAEAVRCMAAAIALFFGLAAAGTVLLFVIGGG